MKPSEEDSSSFLTGLDTNVLVRYLVQDDRAQAKLAARFIEETVAEEKRLFISLIVLCELAWVLESAYDYSKREISDTIEKVVSVSQFEIQDSGIVWATLTDYRASRADFSDCLIGRVHESAGCDTTVSFDKSLKGLPGFRLL